MPIVKFEDTEGNVETVACENGENLRDVLLENGVSPHNIPTALSCHGLGTCATCSVEVVEGDTEEPSTRERLRLKTPVVSPDTEARLACRTEVTGDLYVRRPEGLWGKKDR